MVPDQQPIVITITEHRVVAYRRDLFARSLTDECVWNADDLNLDGIVAGATGRPPARTGQAFIQPEDVAAQAVRS